MNWSLFQCFTTLLFFALACKLLDMKLNSKSGWKPRAIIVLLVVVFFMSGISLDRGWPSRTELPNEFIFIHAVVKAPVDGEDGSIVALIRIKEKPDTPFSIELPYTEELAITLQLMSIHVLTEGEIPVSYTPGKGFGFHLKPAPSGENTNSQGLITPPKFRSV
jgi:hypothetical protein